VPTYDIVMPCLIFFTIVSFSLISFINEIVFSPQLILVDRSERGHYLMELVSEKQKQDLNNNSLSEEITDFVAVLQLEDPQGILKKL